MTLNRLKTEGARRFLWLAIIVAVGSAAALTFSCVAELSRSRSVINTDLKLWAPELADIYSQKDWLRLSKLGKTFSAPPIHSLVFRDGERVVFSFPQETDEGKCVGSDRHTIAQYGAILGSVEVCHDPIAVLGHAASSPLFLVTAISLLFIIGFAAIFPVLAARRGFSSLVDYLSAWSTSNPTGANSPGLSGTPSDRNSVEGKLHALVQDLVGQRLESERKALRAEIIRDVAHNLNSPIASLAIRIQKLGGISPEAAASIHEGLSQISGIVAKLKYATHLPQAPTLPEARAVPTVPPKIEMLSGLLDSIVADKRSEKTDRSDVELIFGHTPESYGAFAAIHALDFRVVLSNLLNNAYESIQGSGKITVRMQINEGHVCIFVRDTGQGIPQEVADKLFTEGFTYGKESGSGRGLFHAKKTLAAWGGNISLQSSEGHGTTTTLELPLAKAPSWFLPEINLNEINQVIVLDDDPSISGVWRMRLPSHEILSYTDPETFSEWLTKNKKSLEDENRRTLFLIDNRLGEGLPSGMDIIELHGIAEDSILVTSDATQESIRKRVIFLGTKLLWKMEVGTIPVLDWGENMLHNVGLKAFSVQPPIEYSNRG
jgi:signal transduction histidine kinase